VSIINQNRAKLAHSGKCNGLSGKKPFIAPNFAQKRLENQINLTTMGQIMKFVLIDKIISLESGSKIETVKSVSLAEEYLADHFPAFPVLPGVLLLEGMIESASWLVREKQKFANSMVLLEQAKNVKYKSFAAPGMQIKYTVTVKSIDENVSSFIGSGVCGDEPIVEARLSLRHFNLSDTDPAMAAVDGHIVASMKKRYELLTL